jgi:hypothetical protein
MPVVVSSTFTWFFPGKAFISFFDFLLQTSNSQPDIAFIGSH